MAMITVTNGHSTMKCGQANGVRGGVIETITFNGLSQEEREYARLVAITNFHQLVWMGEYIKQGLSFGDAVRKYLKS